MTDIAGTVASGFEAVRDAFEENFTKHGDVGAAFSLYVGGEQVVDLWGGIADQTTGRPWTEDTLALVFSTTKGVTAICANLLAQRGELDLDAPVASYWPEFANAGKGEIPVRWLLGHRAGLPALDRVLSPEEVYAWDPICKVLAEQAPMWEPGTAHGYHAVTYGYLVGEVIRRITGRSIGTFFREEIAEPLGVEFWIGLPESEERRVSRLITLPGLGDGEGPSQEVIDSLPEEMREMVRAFTDPTSVTQRALRLTDPAMDFNSREMHAAEVPAAAGIGSARGLAKLYAATIGAVDGHERILSPETVADMTREVSNGPDKVLFIETRFGSGFFLSSSFSPLFGPNSFGHAGAGGSLALADPDAGIGFAYVMNKMDQNLAGDPRTLALLAAVERSLS
jgi:CubicO group peptidase (beta-lactamase class C family)